MIKSQIQGLRVKKTEEETELITDHNGKDLTFESPCWEGTYKSIGNSYFPHRLSRPTMSQTSSLVYGAFLPLIDKSTPDNEHAKWIRRLIENRPLFGFTIIHYIPNKGAYIQDHQGYTDGVHPNVLMEESDLVKKIESNDSSVKFIPFGFPVGEISPSELGNNPFLIALAGQEGAEKLAKVADTFKYKPFLESLESVEEPMVRVSSLDSNRGLNLKIGAFFDGFGDGRFGKVFPVRKNLEEITPKNKYS